MRSLVPSALLAAVVMALLPTMPQPAHAGAGVVRCAMPDGSHVYTSKACSAFGATSAPMPGELLSRIERDLRREAASSGATHPSRQAMALNPAATPALRRMASGCANSPQQLAMDLHAAVSSGDVNRVAESYHWNGMGNSAAHRVMLRLGQLTARTMTSVEYFDARIGGLGSGFADAAGSDRADGKAGMLQALVAAGDGTQVVDFTVQRDQGCFFVRY